MMKTIYGNNIDYVKCEVSKVDIEEIAHALSGINRFGGHSVLPHNVAYHSVLVSEKCPPEHALWGLMHDAAEAYMGDIVRPLKYQFPQLLTMEDTFLKQIADELGLGWPVPPCIKDIDNCILATEFKSPDIYPQNFEPFEGLGALPYPDMVIEYLPAEDSSCVFLDRYHALKK